MATSFGDLQIDRITTVDTYLSGIASPFKREMTAVMLNWAQSIYPLIRLSSPDLPAELPQVKIISDLGLQAQGMEGMIYFGRDLIDHCLGINHANTFEVLSIDTSFMPMVMHCSILTWIYAHECHHIGRRHNYLLEHVEPDEVTLRAIERDADLCAVASLYRGMQNIFRGRMSDIDVRKIAMYAVFLALRTLPTTRRRTHSLPADRMRFALSKLAMLNLNPCDPNVDVNLQNEVSIRRFEDLAYALVAVEKDFRAANPGQHSDFDIHAAFLGEGDSEAVARWDEIRTLHSVLVGQIT